MALSFGLLPQSLHVFMPLREGPTPQSFDERRGLCAAERTQSSPLIKRFSGEAAVYEGMAPTV